MAGYSRYQLIRLLRGETVRRIRFSFPAGSTTMSVVRADFMAVARALEDNHIGVSVEVQSANVGASYDTVNTSTLSGRFSMPPGYVGRYAECNAVHEAVHAAFDLQRRTVTALDEEAAAYVAGGLYCRMTNLPLERYRTNIRAVAKAVVDDILVQYQRGDVAVPQVDAATWNALRGVIPVSPTYLGGPAASGGSYTHDG